MKNQNNFHFPILFVLSLLLLVSCAKEQDTTSAVTELEAPTIVDGNLLASTILIGDGSGLPEVTIVFKSETFETTIETNMTGHFSFVIPTDVTEGVLIAYKESYTTLFFTYNNDFNMPSSITFSDAYGEWQEPSLDISDLWTMEGRVIYPDGSVPENLICNVSSWESDTDPFRIILMGQFSVNPDGRFMITGDSLSTRPTIDIGGHSKSDRCIGGYGIRHKVQEAHTILPDLIYDRDWEEHIDIEVSAAECNVGLVAKSYYGAQQPLGLFDEKLGSLSVPYCPDLGPKYAYVGVEDASADNFDGNFYPELDQGSQHELFPCTPDGYFFDIVKDGMTYSYDVNFDAENETFVFSDPNVYIAYDSDPQYSNCNGSSCGLKEFHFTWMTSFTFVDTANNDRNIPITKGFMDNVLNNDKLIAGIIMPGKDSQEEFKIRFRIEKI